MKLERSVLDVEGHWKVRRLCYGGLEFTVADETPRASKIRDDDEFDETLGHWL